MLDKKARESLAKEIIDSISNQWHDKGKPWTLFNEITVDSSGNTRITFGNTSEEGYGSFLCVYLPLRAVEKIIANCERIFDALTADTYLKEEAREKGLSLKDKENEVGFREKMVTDMSALATQAFLLSMRSEFCEAVEGTFEDALFLAEAMLINDVVEQSHERPGSKRVVVDGRSALENHISKATLKKRAKLTGLLGALPDMVVATRRGPRPRIVVAKVQDAVIRHGGLSALLKSVAFDLGVTEKGLEDWYKRSGFDNWEQTKQGLLSTLETKFSGIGHSQH